MPPLPSPGQVVEMVFQYHLDDGVAQNRQFFSYSGSAAPAVSDLSNLWSHISTDFLAAYTGAALPAVASDFIRITDLKTSSGAIYSTVPGFSGSNTGSTLPASAAVCVQHLISRRYRGGHPRTYMMVGTASDYATSSIKNWQASFLTNIQNGWDSYQALFPYNAPLGQWNRVNVSWYETVGGVRTVRTTPLVDLITGDIAKERVCSQRRRLGKIGG